MRELGEELGVRPLGPQLLCVVDAIAALERAPMRMTVFSAELSGSPRPAAELAALGWTDGLDEYHGRLASAVADQILPRLRAAGRLRPSM